MAVKMKNRRDCPPGGWLFSIPQAGVVNNQSWTFQEMEDKYIAIALANPRLRLPTDRTAVGNLLEDQNAMRVMGIRGADIYLAVQGGAPPPKMILPRNLAASAEAGNNIASGVELLTDWLGSGKKPVDADLANSRAAKCAGCPMNDKGDWTRFFTLPASASIRKLLEIKHDMSLSTKYDNEIEICSACSCPLKLKVFCGLDLILSHTTLDARKKFHPDCWILKEAEDQKAKSV